MTIRSHIEARVRALYSDEESLARFVEKLAAPSALLQGLSRDELISQLDVLFVEAYGLGSEFSEGLEREFAKYHALHV
jgi:hypothetical protein